MATTEQVMAKALEEGASLRDVETVVRTTNGIDIAAELLSALNIQEPIKGRAGVPVGEDLTADLTAPGSVAGGSVPTRGVALPGSMENTLVTAPRIPNTTTTAEVMGIADVAVMQDMTTRQQAITPGVPMISSPTIPISNTTPGSGMANIASQFARQQESSAEYISQLLADKDLAAEQTDIIVSSLGDAAVAQGTIALQKDTAALQVQNTSIAALDAAGGTKAQVAFMETLKADNKRVIAKSAELQDIMDDEITGIQFVDGIVNSFRSFQTDMELDIAETQQRNTLNSIKAVQAGTESVQATALAAAETINEGVIEANQSMILASARSQAATAVLDGVQNNSTNMRTILAADAQSMNNLVRFQELENSAENRVFRDKEFQLRLQDFAERQENNLLNRQLTEIKVQQTSLDLAIKSESAPDIISARRSAADQAITNLSSSRLALAEGVATSTARVDALLANSESAVTARDAAQFAFDNAKEDRPEQKEALGVTLEANTCGQSLCLTSSSPMPYRCYSCVAQICDIDSACCDTGFNQSCLDKVDTVCGLVCE
jgi:hypothetical protein